MHVRIEHETHYTYDGPIRALIQILRMTPRGHEGQHVRRWRIEPSIDGHLRQDEDELGNIVHHFSAEGGAQSLTLRVFGDVETVDTAGSVRGAITRAPDLFFLRETDLSETDEPLQVFAREAADPREGDELGMLHRLMNGINETLSFDTEPTHVLTTARESFAMRTGVCQDLTHIFIGCARYLGIPARYVSGYFVRIDGVVDQEASHAWAEAKVPGLGWVGFDPANGICITDAHVRVATGLDYLGAAPIRGSRWGGGGESMAVNLLVKNADGESQSQRQNQG